MKIDAVTLALIGETLTSYVREMRTAMIRTAFSPMIHEGHDFCWPKTTSSSSTIPTAAAPISTMSR